MSAPDRIERTVRLAHPPERVWRALTTAEGLGGWFGTWAQVDLRPGGEARVRWDEQTTVLDIKVVEPPRRFGFTWRIEGLPDNDPRRTYVEFTVEAAGAGSVLTVVESGFAQLPAELFTEAYDCNVKGWTEELAELVNYLDVHP